MPLNNTKLIHFFGVTTLWKTSLEFVQDLLGTGEDGIRFIDYLRASRSEFEELTSYLAFLERHAALICDGPPSSVGQADEA